MNPSAPDRLRSPAWRKLMRALAIAPLAAATAWCLAGSPATAASDTGDTGNAATPSNGSSTYRIDIHDFAFSPKEITVPVGARIVWTNRDDEPHTVVSAAGAFKPSQALDTDDSFSTVFDKPGTYAFFCGIHPMMVGKIVVR
jgi:plastocyanin